MDKGETMKNEKLEKVEITSHEKYLILSAIDKQIDNADQMIFWLESNEYKNQVKESNKNSLFPRTDYEIKEQIERQIADKRHTRKVYTDLFNKLINGKLSEYFLKGEQVKNEH